MSVDSEAKKDLIFANYLCADLNDDEFPLNTNTYRINRGMRVETAAIVALFLLGVVSQLRLWKIIKTRRERKEWERRGKNRSRKVFDGFS